MWDWYYPQAFQLGETYVDADGELILEFAGILSAKAARAALGIAADIVDTDDDSEPVLVFLIVTKDEHAVAMYTHTRRDADSGYGFFEVADRPQTNDWNSCSPKS
jgi:hypothetical protein